MNTEELTLRQLIEKKFRDLSTELDSLREGIKIMSDLILSSPHELDLLKLQVAGLSESLHDLEIRVNQLERHSGVATEVSRQAFTIFILLIVLIAWGVMT